MGLTQRISILLLIVFLVGVSSCIKELPLETDDVVSYFFIDGNIVVGEDLQTLTIGRTNGVATSIPVPVRGATVVVKDYTNQRDYLYQESGVGKYIRSFEGKLETDYQLFVTFQSGETFSTDTLRLDAVSSLGFTGTVAPKSRVSPAGDSVITNVVAATLNFQIPSTASSDLLVIRSSFEYSISDLICGPFDGAVKCYFIDDVSVDLFGLVDLSIYGPGEEGTIQVGSYGIDARMAEESVVIVDVFRADTQAKPYYRSIASSVALGGNFFSPQPLTVPGNLVSLQAGNGAALGYFGVIERTSIVLPANSAEIKRRAGLPYCDGGSADFLRWDCCYCFANLGGNTNRPSYWP